jgi:hypothetical protein
MGLIGEERLPHNRNNTDISYPEEISVVHSGFEYTNYVNNVSLLTYQTNIVLSDSVNVPGVVS